MIIDAMRGALHRLFTIIIVLSLLMCVATGALWVRSYWRTDLVGYDGRERDGYWQRGGNLSSSRGEIGLEWWLRQNETSRTVMGRRWGFESWPDPEPTRSWHHFAFNAAQFGLDRKTYAHFVSLPHALLVILFAMPGALWFIRFQRRRRIEARIEEMRCAVCGYDLRASLARCPECGAIIRIAR